jgi:hypothetical protein
MTSYMGAIQSVELEKLRFWGLHGRETLNRPHAVRLAARWAENWAKTLPRETVWSKAELNRRVRTEIPD